MTDIQDIASGVSDSTNVERRKLVDPFESVGKPGDAAATSASAENSVFSLLKGCLDDLGVDAGSGAGAVNVSPNTVHNPVATLGDASDSASANLTGAHSAIALTKHVLSLAGL